MLARIGKAEEQEASDSDSIIKTVEQPMALAKEDQNACIYHIAEGELTHTSILGRRRRPPRYLVKAATERFRKRKAFT